MWTRYGWRLDIAAVPSYLERVQHGRAGMSEMDNKYIARNMITLHELRATAVVRERMAEARLRGDTAAMEQWQNVEAAIAELRRTAPAHSVQA